MCLGSFENVDECVLNPIKIVHFEEFNTTAVVFLKSPDNANQIFAWNYVVVSSLIITCVLINGCALKCLLYVARIKKKMENGKWKRNEYVISNFVVASVGSSSSL
jgi:hypothetical protein